MKSTAKETSVTVALDATEVAVSKIKSAKEPGPVENTEKQPETVIYIGESLPKGVLDQFSVFNNGLPEQVKEHIEQCPAIQELIVPVEIFPETKRNLNSSGTREWTLNRLVKEYIGGAY